MYSNETGNDDDRVPTGRALRHLLIFQLKLAADALRDFLLSPLSIFAFVLDVLFKLPAKRSLYLRLMLLGRQSDRMINLFDDHADKGEFTIDRAVDELEVALRTAKTATAQPDAPGNTDAAQSDGADEAVPPADSARRE